LEPFRTRRFSSSAQSGTSVVLPCNRLKERSARGIAGVLSSHTEDAQRLGADLVVALDVDKDVDAAPMVDAIADTVDGSTAAAVVRKLKTGGVFASVLCPPSNATERRELVFKTMQAKLDPATLVRMACAVHDRTFSIPISKSFPLKDANAAHAAAEGARSGKILLLAR